MYEGSEVFVSSSGSRLASCRLHSAQAFGTVAGGDYRGAASVSVHPKGSLEGWGWSS